MKRNHVFILASALMGTAILLSIGSWLVWHYARTDCLVSSGERIDDHFRGYRIFVQFSYAPATPFSAPEGFRQIDTDPGRPIASIDVMGNAFSDEDLLYLSRLPRFRSLDALTIESDSITDEGVASICMFTDLRRLALTSKNITDTAMLSLKPLKNLEAVILTGCSMITGRNLGCLCDLPNLSALSLELTDLSDDAIPELCKLRALNELRVEGTELSDEGLKRLTNCLPKTCSLFCRSIEGEQD